MLAAQIRLNGLFTGLLLIAVLLSGCSAVRLVYNQADTMLSWMAQDYFELDSAQRQDFNARLDPLLNWHRHEQLPEYVRFLDEIRQRTERSLKRDDALWLIEGAKARFRVITNKGAADAAALLENLTPENIRALEKSFGKFNRDFVREHKLNDTPEERRSARLDRTLKRIRDWTGTLTAEQEARIAVLNNAIPYTDHLRHQDRQRRQKEFLALLSERTNKSEFARRLRPWLADWEAGRAPATQASINEGNEKRIALYLEVFNGLTPQQRARMQQKLQGYIDDLNALSAKRVAGG